MKRYALMAKSKMRIAERPLCIYVTSYKAKAEADAERRESKYVHYWVLPYEEAFPDSSG
jgi:hypothetical protein